MPVCEQVEIDLESRSSALELGKSNFREADTVFERGRKVLRRPRKVSLIGRRYSFEFRKAKIQISGLRIKESRYIDCKSVGGILEPYQYRLKTSKVSSKVSSLSLH